MQAALCSQQVQSAGESSAAGELLWAFSVEIEVQLVPPSSTSTCRLLTVCQCSLIKRYPVLECVTSSASKVPLNAHLRRTDWATGSFSQAKTHSLGTFALSRSPNAPHFLFDMPRLSRSSSLKTQCCSCKLPAPAQACEKKLHPQFVQVILAVIASTVSYLHLAMSCLYSDLLPGYCTTGRILKNTWRKEK